MDTGAQDDQQKKDPLLEEYLNGWKRAAADLANYKKEEGKRMEDFASYSSMKMLREILPVLDSFSLALSAVKGNESAEKGLLIIKSQLDDFLKRQNVERISVSPGDVVDLNIHEPVVEADGPPERAGKIVEELSPGYKMNSRVIRPAKVTVGK